MNHDLTPQPNPLSDQPKSSRRVVFSDSLPKHRRRRFKFCRRFLACCGWICIAVLGIALTALILVAILTSVLESGLPEIRVRILDLSEFAIQNSTDPNTGLLDARVLMSIQIWNKNEKMELSYSDMEVNFASEGVELGQNMVSGFAQVPGNTTLLKVTMHVEGDSKALGLEDDRRKMEMNVQVTIKARIDFDLGVFELNQVLIYVDCEFLQSLRVYSVKDPSSCKIRMFLTL